MSNIIKTIQDACDILNSQNIFLMQIRVPKNIKEEFDKEIQATDVEEIDIEKGKTLINKISVGDNSIKIIWYENGK